MDRLIWVAWRAFWVGVGASAVLITQTVIAPAPAARRAVPPSAESGDHGPSRDIAERAPPSLATKRGQPLSSSAERGARGRTHS